ncbi:MAG: hypothetical protein EB100_04490 [Crocinitomicaceae bacterium]|nr:hypothetical protein [Crocinitomicaceae bacterium]
MATKTTRAANAQRRATKAQKRKAKAKAAVKSAKASLNNFSNPKTNNMGQTKSGNAKIEAKDIRVGISFFMNHPKVGHQVIDFATDLERFTTTYNHVNQSEEYRYSSKYQFHNMMMDLYVSDAPIDEIFFTIAMHFLVTFDSVGAALKSNKFPNYGFMIEPVYDDFEAGMVGTLDYDSWDYGRITRNAA